MNKQVGILLFAVYYLIWEGSTKYYTLFDVINDPNHLAYVTQETKIMYLKT